MGAPAAEDEDVAHFLAEQFKRETTTLLPLWPENCGVLKDLNLVTVLLLLLAYVLVLLS